MGNPSGRSALEALHADEVLPVLTAAGDASAAAYVGHTLDRFANPFLDRRLSDIAQNHGERLERRIGDVLDWSETLGCKVSNRALATRWPELFLI